MRISLPSSIGGLDASALLGRRGTSLFSGRRTQGRIILAVVALLVFFTVYPSPPLPTSYSAEWAAERALPQHDKNLPAPEGRHGRYVRFDVPRGTGISHQLQHVILQHYLAVSSNRSLAFVPLVEDEAMLLPFKLFRWPWRNAVMPVSAVAGSVLSGFERVSRKPRAVSARHYDSVCRRRETEYHVGVTADSAVQLDAGKDRLEQLVNLLKGDEPCVRILGDALDDDWLESPALIDLADKIATSPALKFFTFAPRVLEILNRMVNELAEGSEKYDLHRALRASGKGAPHLTPWKHILALQLPHAPGWLDECRSRGYRSAPFVGFNKLPHLPGNENVPPPEEMVEATRLGLYTAKCHPDTSAIIARARRMRKNHPLLRTIYIMTDAPKAWAEEMRRWLASDGWDKVFVGSVDVHGDWDDRELGPAVDMEVARRAGVFVGNGFTSTASLIALLRQRDEIHPDFTQFW